MYTQIAHIDGRRGVGIRMIGVEHIQVMWDDGSTSYVQKDYLGFRLSDEADYTRPPCVVTVELAA